MISCILQGGMCNQAFTTMATIALSKKWNTSYAIPSHTANPRWPHYKFGNVHYEDIDTINFYHYKCPDIFYDQRPYNVSYQEIPYHENIILEGHFQSWKYWIDYIDEIRDLFNFPYEFRVDTVSIHKRLGDYVSMSDKLPPVSTAYIADAINHFADQGYKRFLAFSDDIEVFKDEIYLLLMNRSIRNGLCIQFSEGWTDVDDLVFMSSCAHQILANSSYSLLAYYLNQNPNKQCVAPAIWTGPGYGDVHWDDVYPMGCTII